MLANASGLQSMDVLGNRVKQNENPLVALSIGLGVYYLVLEGGPKIAIHHKILDSRTPKPGKGTNGKVSYHASNYYIDTSNYYITQVSGLKIS